MLIEEKIVELLKDKIIYENNDEILRILNEIFERIIHIYADFDAYKEAKKPKSKSKSKSKSRSRLSR